MFGGLVIWWVGWFCRLAIYGGLAGCLVGWLYGGLAGHVKVWLFCWLVVLGAGFFGELVKWWMCGLVVWWAAWLYGG